ncbi:sigma-70 family RNA polymerase sigma factor [Hyphomicrobium sp.]|uniref:sigma-70 family RNA polymerase sigma factor n=1 Tax=Hyphomicrobium sp. TaxID=82 RepID=UPI000FBE46B9|nr:sigma-70 family RNA polymerase sigma factor [Hyphomicrobium sp.]RUP08299.1 MAG: sigma-70 family RNA polymerase sigma factor [Hyphomicrobium sp.]
MDDRQRFREVVLPHLDDALSLARWLTGNVPDAEDVVQDACLRAYRAIATTKDINPRAWLLAIVRNAAFTWLAKNRPKTAVTTNDEALFERASLEMVDPQASPETILIGKIDAEQLHTAIAALPLPYRETLLLREIEELSYQEISKILSIPIGTVMSRLARARNLLIQRLAMAGKGKAGAA